MTLRHVRCPNCNASLRPDREGGTLTCAYCGAVFEADAPAGRAPEKPAEPLTAEKPAAPPAPETKTPARRSGMIRFFRAIGITSCAIWLLLLAAYILDEGLKDAVGTVAIIIMAAPAAAILYLLLKKT